MKLMICIPAAALAMTLAACATDAPAASKSAATASSASVTRASSHGDDGTVTGTFTRVGGPLGPDGTQPRPVPLMGTLIFSAGHHRTVAVHVGKTGRFSVGLPAGTYVVTGRSPLMGDGAQVDPPCTPPTPVTAVAGRTVHLAVVCPVP